MLSEVVEGKKYLMGNSIIVNCVKVDIDEPIHFEECLFVGSAGTEYEMSIEQACKTLREVI